MALSYESATLPLFAWKQQHYLPDNHEARLVMEDREIVKNLNRGGTARKAAWDYLAGTHDKTIRYWVRKYHANFAAMSRNVDPEDAVQHVKSQLPRMLRSFDADKSKLSTYLPHRIRGAVLDMLRTPEWRLGLSKYVARTRGPIRDAVSLSKFLTPADGVHKRLQLGDTIADRSPTSFNERHQDFCEVVKHLPQLQRQVLYLRYVRELTMREAGEILDLGESRISQIHSMAIERLKRDIKSHIDEPS